jgi:hypothetical protein
MFDLVAKKVSTSLQVDGLDLRAALEAAGASGDETTSSSIALSLGQAVYRALSASGNSSAALGTPSWSRLHAATQRP